MAFTETPPSPTTAQLLDDLLAHDDHRRASPDETTLRMLSQACDLLIAVHDHGTLPDDDRLEIEQAASAVLRVLQEGLPESEHDHGLDALE